MSLRFLVVFTVAAIMKHNLQRKQRMVLRTDCGDGVHREEFSHTRAFAIVLVLGLNACFVLFWSRLLFVVFLSDGTH